MAELRGGPVSAVSVWPALACIALALCVAFGLAKLFGQAPAPGRFASLDGLRGYLAFFVFLHHGAISYFRAHPNEPGDRLPRLYAHFGESSVGLFFMITGFLFFSKIIDGRARPIDWTRLYVSRVLRLLPLYWFAIGVMFLIVACISGFRLHEPPVLLAKKVLSWMSFTVLGAPDLNGVLHTKRIIWSVIWTLRYEWLFYISLPLMAICLRAAVPLRFVILSAVLGTGFLITGTRESNWLAMFGGGIVAAFLVRSAKFQSLARGKAAGVIALSCLGIAFFVLPAGFSALNLLLLSVGFCLIAGGSTLFGVLGWPASRMLGEMCYSMYLLHGLVLYCVFQFGFGLDRAGRLSPTQHWLVIWGSVPVLVALCFVTFRLIEAPGMACTSAVCAKLDEFMKRWGISLQSRAGKQAHTSGSKIHPELCTISLTTTDGAQASSHPVGEV
jgi:peptidoglycan/LPS O-acetylase OafA/YrhL